MRRLFGSDGGQAVELQLRGYDLIFVDELVQHITRVMESIPEISDVRVSRREGRPEQNLIVDCEKILVSAKLLCRQDADVCVRYL